ncbi:hypothetical protein AVEN_66230-1 [Araneus ventricosus]|uniref:Uncharacterized protein n=1 Tax=Araneus ventricosus TaxID=182803 RepID=A0A4Y2I5X4_ARAVE|nr:hypothetical protein AVEN_66230-1 [Araneus ventricosus]
MEGQVRTLQQMALRKLALNLWNAFLAESGPSLTLTQDQLEFAINKVQDKVPLIGLPRSITGKLIKEITPIGVEIRRWRKYHRLLIPSQVSRNALNQLCWTSQGTVDYRKTAEGLIRQEHVDDFNGYKLSCLYCFEDDIRKFWSKIPENCKRLYYSENTPLRDLDRRQVNLIQVWSHFLEGDTNLLMDENEDEPQRIFQYAFKRAAYSGNKAATEYFFQKLTDLQKEVCLVKTAQRVIRKRVHHVFIKPQHRFPRKKFCDVLIYLLSQMSEVKQIEVFKKRPGGTLICFLDWPWQDLFFKVAGHLWPFLSSRECQEVLYRLSINRKHPEYNYESIFGEFFPTAYGLYRNDFINNLWHWHEPWFPGLFLSDMRECIKLVLGSLSAAEREGFIVSDCGVSLCWMLLVEEKWFLLELFVKECTLSKEAKIELKDSLREEWEIGDRIGDWEKFLQVMDNLDGSASNKRFIEESETEQPNKKR